MTSLSNFDFHVDPAFSSWSRDERVSERTKAITEAAADRMTAEVCRDPGSFAVEQISGRLHAYDGELDALVHVCLIGPSPLNEPEAIGRRFLALVQNTLQMVASDGAAEQAENEVDSEVIDEAEDAPDGGDRDEEEAFA